MYLGNRMPTQVVRDMTPYEACHDTRPNVSHLCIFGCISYAFIPQELWSKLDTRVLNAFSLDIVMKLKDIDCLIP